MVSFVVTFLFNLLWNLYYITLSFGIFCCYACCYLTIDFAWMFFAPQSKEGFDKKQESELLNGRLAMIAVGGIATQSIVGGHGFPYLL